MLQPGSFLRSHTTSDAQHCTGDSQLLSWAKPTSLNPHAYRPLSDRLACISQFVHTLTRLFCGQKGEKYPGNPTRLLIWVIGKDLKVLKDQGWQVDRRKLRTSTGFSYLLHQTDPQRVAVGLTRLTGAQGCLRGRAAEVPVPLQQTECGHQLRVKIFCKGVITGKKQSKEIKNGR